MNKNRFSRPPFSASKYLVTVQCTYYASDTVPVRALLWCCLSSAGGDGEGSPCRCSSAPPPLYTNKEFSAFLYT